jgi:predicted PurR-regulated permease PerM
MSASQAFRTTLVVLLTIAIAYALVLSARILIVLLFALIVASAVRPAFIWLRDRKIPEGIAILLIYLVLGISIFTVGGAVIPPAVDQLAGYIENEDRLATRIITAQRWIESAATRISGNEVTIAAEDDVRRFVERTVIQLRASGPEMAGEAGALIGDFILVIVIGAYWLTARDQAVNWGKSLFSMGRRTVIENIILEIEHNMGYYIRGIVLVALFVGVANFIILTILRVPNAVTLAFIMGVTTMLPIIGGYIGAGVSVIIALISGPIPALGALASFVLVQQVENHWLTPAVMSRSVGLNPILIIVFLFVGFALGGVTGAFLSVPLAGTVATLLRYLVIEPRKDEVAPRHVEGGILIASPDGTSISTPQPATGIVQETNGEPAPKILRP